MKTKLHTALRAGLALISALSFQLSAFSQGTAFTYQGRLETGGTAYTGLAEMQFSLWTANTGGSQLGSTLAVTPVGVTNGLFTVALDFGNQFPGANRWLELAVRTNLLGFSTLSPRQLLTATPYALTASNLSGTLPATQLTGTVADARLSATVSLLGQSIESAEIMDGTILNADLSGSAAIADTKLATISSAGKVANSATTATSANTANAIVARDASGNFSAARVTAAFSGDGASLTSLNASQLSSGTVSDARLSGNVALRSGGNTFSGDQFVFTGDLGLGTSNPESRLDVRGPATFQAGVLGNNDNLVIKKEGNLSPYSNVRFVFSHRSGGTELWLYGHDGTTYQNLQGWDHARNLVCFPANGNTLLIDQARARVGIGRQSSANAFEVEGNASKNVAGSWLANSDARIKQDIAPVSDALDTLDRVRLVSFRYTEDYRQRHPSVEDQRYLNVVAQEFREVFPHAVKSSGEKLPDGSEILQVDTYPLTIYSAAAIQELNQKVEVRSQESEVRVKKLEAENAELRQELAAIKSMLNQLIPTKE